MYQLPVIPVRRYLRSFSTSGFYIRRGNFGDRDIDKLIIFVAHSKKLPYFYFRAEIWCQIRIQRTR